MKYVILEARDPEPGDALAKLEKKVNLLVNRKLPEGVPDVSRRMDYEFMFDESLKKEPVKESCSLPINLRKSGAWRNFSALIDVEPFTGWRPLGGHQLAYDSTTMEWHASQTMVNEND